LQILKNLRQYGRLLSGIDPETAKEMTSGLFELNTSLNPYFVKWVLDGSPHKGLATSPDHIYDLIWLLRDLAKWSLIILLVAIFYKKKKKHLKILKKSKKVFVGFVNLHHGQLNAKDYEGFRQSIGSKALSITIGLRLPNINLVQYIRGSKDVIPVLAFVRFRDLFAGLAKQRIFHEKVFKSKNVPAEMKTLCARDIKSGHALGSFLIGETVARLCRSTSRNAKVYFPMERHNWEQLAITRLSGIRRTEAVQNCTFSAVDLNMYCHTPGLPNFRKTVPDKLHVLDSNWKFVFMRKLKFKCEISIMKKHRFSKKNILLNLNGQTPRILYLASINQEKLFLDLNTLSNLRGQIIIEVRLHPSLMNVALPIGFTKANSISGAYGWCVYADTTMVFQLKCKREYLLFIRHESFPNQDPTRWISGFGSRQVSASRINSIQK